MEREDSINQKMYEEEQAIKLNQSLKPLSKFITAIGNFSIQYNFQSISIALLVMAASQCTANDDECKDGTQASWVTTSATATVFLGAITGQLTMGYAGDMLGRNVAMILTLSLVVVGAILSAVASQGSPTAVYSVVILFRFVLGIGAGGVYPLSATKAAEDSGSGEGVNIHAASLAFFWQQPGAMTPWFLALVFLTIPGLSNDVLWRLLLGLGALPALIVVCLSYYEISLKAKSRRLLNSEGYGDRTVSSNAKDAEYIRHVLRQRETWRDLAATGGGWFIYDVAYYGVNLFGGEILSNISSTDDDNISSHHSLAHICSLQLIALGLGVPACLASIYALSHVSTKTLQVGGFLMITFCFFLLAVLFVPLRNSSPNGLFAVYCGLLFSLSFGPNLTTYLLPAQTYPKKVRATLNGISAACGKLGAFVGVYLFGSIAEASSYPVVMAVCAVLSLCGALVSWKYIVCENALEVPRRRESLLRASELGWPGKQGKEDPLGFFSSHSATESPLMADNSNHSFYTPGKL